MVPVKRKDRRQTWLFICSSFFGSSVSSVGCFWSSGKSAKISAGFSFGFSRFSVPVKGRSPQSACGKSSVSFGTTSSKVSGGSLNPKPQNQKIKFHSHGVSPMVECGCPLGLISILSPKIQNVVCVASPFGMKPKVLHKQLKSVSKWLAKCRHHGEVWG